MHDDVLLAMVVKRSTPHMIQQSALYSTVCVYRVQALVFETFVHVDEYSI